MRYSLGIVKFLGWEYPLENWKNLNGVTSQ